MFRTAVLSIVLTLAVGQNAALLCSTWCDAHAQAARACHHKDPTPAGSVSAGDDCCNVVLGTSTTAFLREDVQLGSSSADPDDAIPVTRYQPAHSTIAARTRPEPGWTWSLEQRHLLTALRI